MGNSLHRRKVAVLALALAGLANTATASSAAGRSAAPILNTILSGNGAPKTSLGHNGDFYIDRANFSMYGPKTKNKWPLPFSIKGPAGASTVSGKGSSSGADISTGVASKGEAGAIGPRGLTGAQGVPGVPGIPGTVGAKGDPGAVGPAGPAGANGFGSPGANGANGAAGATGATGAKGDTGTAGPSATVYGLITYVNPISDPFTYQDSNPFGTFISGKSYVLDIYLRSTLADGGSGNLGISFNATGGLRIVQSSYSITTGNSFRTGTSKLETTALAKLLVTIDTQINPKVVITATSGNASSGNLQTLTGYFTQQEVGTVS